MRNLGREGRWVQDTFTTPSTEHLPRRQPGRGARLERGAGHRLDHDRLQQPERADDFPHGLHDRNRGRQRRGHDELDHLRRSSVAGRGRVVRGDDDRLADGPGLRHAGLQRVPRGERRARQAERRSRSRAGALGRRGRAAIRSSTRDRPSPDASTGSRTSPSRWTAGGTAPSRRSRRRTARRSRCPVRSARAFRPPAHPASVPRHPARARATRSAAVLSRARRSRFSCRPARAGGAGAGGSPSPEAVMIGA